MITENVSTLKIHKLTQEQYNRELENGNIEENAIYLTPGEEVTPESVGALPTTGGTMTGDIVFDDSGAIIRTNSDNQTLHLITGGGKSLLATNRTASLGLVSINGNGYFQLTSKEGVNEGVLTGLGNTLTWNEKNLFGEHNKPTGTYIGDGSATMRTIDTGGTGDVCVITCGYYAAIVTYSGAICFYCNAGSTKCEALASTQVVFREGKLYIAIANSYVNINGYTHKYQVL